MKLSKGLLLLLVFGTFVLLSQGAQTAKGSKRDKKGKGKRRQETDVADVAEVADPPETPVVNPTTEAQGDAPEDQGVVPSVEHNGKLGKREKKERKAAKKAAKKEKAKALRKAEKKRLRKEERKAHKQAEKAERKAAKKAARKEAHNGQAGEDAGGEIVSFDDIVQERHGDPIPNPLPPVEGANTEPDNTGGTVNDQATLSKAERKHQKKLDRQREKQQKKEAKKERRRHKEHITCESDDDCGHGSCCIEKKGTHYCVKSKKDEGQKCSADCMCRAGLMCAIEEISPGKERGFCRVRGTSELGAGNDVGAVEDAVEDAIGVNQ